jgi:hypothetical protein
VEELDCFRNFLQDGSPTFLSHTPTLQIQVTVVEVCPSAGQFQRHPSIHPSTHPQSPASPTRTIRSHSLTRCTPLNFHWIRGWRPLRPNCSRMRLTALREDIHSDCRKAAGNPDLAPLARLFCHQHEVYKKRPDINRISYPFPLVVSSSVHPLSCRRQQRSRRSS